MNCPDLLPSRLLPTPPRTPHPPPQLPSSQPSGQGSGKTGRAGHIPKEDTSPIGTKTGLVKIKVDFGQGREDSSLGKGYLSLSS